MVDENEKERWQFIRSAKSDTPSNRDNYDGYSFGTGDLNVGLYFVSGSFHFAARLCIKLQFIYTVSVLLRVLFALCE